MIEQLNVTAEINGIETDVRIMRGAHDTSFHLELPFGTSVPLASVNVAEGKSYCYFGVGVGEEYVETRVYSDGSVVTH